MSGEQEARDEMTRALEAIGESICQAEEMVEQYQQRLDSDEHDEFERGILVGAAVMLKTMTTLLREDMGNLPEDLQP